MNLSPLQRNHLDRLWLAPGAAFRWLLMQHRHRVLDEIPDEQIHDSLKEAIECPFDPVDRVPSPRSWQRVRLRRLSHELHSRIELAVVDLLARSDADPTRWTGPGEKRCARRLAEWLAQRDGPFEPVAFAVHVTQTGLLGRFVEPGTSPRRNRANIRRSDSDAG